MTDRRFLAIATLAGMAGFGLACMVLHMLTLAGAYGPLSDALFISRDWADAANVLQHGLVPYRDFPLEYPPLSLPVFLLPGLLTGGGARYEDYRAAFELIVSIIGIGTVPVITATLSRLRASRPEVLLAVGFVTISPLLMGSLAISRWDAWPALLAAAAVAALLWDRHRIGFALLALGVLAKAYPAVLAPIFVAWTWRRAGRREALIGLGLGLAVGLAGLLPFVALDPAGALDPITGTIARPLQIESLGAAILVALHDLARLPLGPADHTFDSYNLEGQLPSLVATAESAALALVLVVIWISAARRAAAGGRFVLACAAAICATVALGKILSPQYVLWLVPAVAILGPVAGRRPLAIVVVVLVLTALYYPHGYTSYFRDFALQPTLIVLARDVALVALAADMVWRTLRADGIVGPRPQPLPEVAAYVG